MAGSLAVGVYVLCPLIIVVAVVGIVLIWRQDKRGSSSRRSMELAGPGESEEIKAMNPKAPNGHVARGVWLHDDSMA